MIDNQELAAIVRKSLTMDAEAFCVKEHDKKAFIEANSFQYNVAVNTWVCLVADLVGEEAEYAFTLTLNRLGLRTSIAQCAELALAIIRNNMVDCHVSEGFLHVYYCMRQRNLDMKSMLQVLRFLKRFTITSAPGMIKECEYAFNKTNNMNKELDRVEIPYYFMRLAKHVASVLFPTAVLRMTDEDVNYEADGKFSNGSTANAGKFLKDKLKWWDEPYYLNFKNHLTNKERSDCRPYYETNGALIWPRHTCKFASVPKSYKTYRSICMESAHANWHLNAVAAAVIRAWDGDPERCINIFLDDQTINGYVVNEPNMSSIDLSHASDSVRTTVVAELFPALKRVADQYRSTAVKMPSGGFMPLYCYSTMGSPITFPLECMTFLVIATVAGCLYELFTAGRIKHTARRGDKLEFYSKHPNMIFGEIGSLTNSKIREVASRIFVYGDDIATPCEYFETTCDILSIFGFSVNTDKSFSECSFTESCGFDWWDGELVSSTYWPRKFIPSPDAVDKTKKHINYECLLHLLPLHNAIFSNWINCFHTHTYLAGVIRKVCPRITSSTLSEYREYHTSDIVDYVGNHGVFVHNGHEYPVMTTVMAKPVDMYLYGVSDGVTMMPTNEYQYYEFLRKGPHYEDELLRLLGCSTPRFLPTMCFTGTEARVVKKTLF